MTDIIQAIEADAATMTERAKAQTTALIAGTKPLVASRIGDVLIAAIVIGSIWIGHIL